MVISIIGRRIHGQIGFACDQDLGDDVLLQVIDPWMLDLGIGELGA